MLNRGIEEKKSFLQKVGLGTRLAIIFISLLFLSLYIVGITSYMKAKDMMKETIENRLEREAELMGYIAENLKFVYISDENYFMQQLNMSVRSQKQKLEKEGISSDFFYIADGSVTPFNVSKKTIPSISDKIIKDITAQKSGLIHRQIGGEEYTITFLEMKELNGIYGLIIPTKTYMENVNQIAYFTMMITGLSIVAATIFIFIFIRALTKPLTQLRNAMRKVREGDLTNQTLPIRTTIPEITSLHKSFQAMMEQMRDMLFEIKETTKALETTGEKLRLSSENSLSSSQQLVSSIHIVRKGAEQTAVSSDESVSHFNHMTEKIKEMLRKMEIVFQSSENMNISAAKGEENITKLISNIHAIEKDFGHLTTTVQQVKNYSLSITHLIDLVNGIAEQTKLLALNASIEAARAGDAGKGFAVVAKEVRNLADQSTKTTEEISKAITGMEQITAEASSEFDLMLKKIGNNLRMAEESKISFDDLMKYISIVSGDLEGLEGRLKELENILPKMNQVVQQFSSISQETLTSAEEMLASSEMQIEQMESTNRIGQKLHDLSKALSSITRRFRVNN